MLSKSPELFCSLEEKRALRRALTVFLLAFLRKFLEEWLCDEVSARRRSTIAALAANCFPFSRKESIVSPTSATLLWSEEKREDGDEACAFTKNMGLLTVYIHFPPHVSTSALSSRSVSDVMVSSPGVSVTCPPHLQQRKMGDLHIRVEHCCLVSMAGPWRPSSQWTKCKVKMRLMRSNCSALYRFSN